MFLIRKLEVKAQRAPAVMFVFSLIPHSLFELSDVAKKFCRFSSTVTVAIWNIAYDWQQSGGVDV